MTDTPPRILIVDDDPEITSALARGLMLHGYDPVTENRVDAARTRLQHDALSAAIIDVMIGEDSGIDLVRGLRDDGLTLPVLMLSALSEVDDRTRGLEAGADDYIVKPFSFDELVARLKVQERRADSLRPRPATLDATARTLTQGPAQVQLTERECALLALLVQNAGDTLSRGQIFDALWAEEGSSSENVVDVYLGYLRRKLGPDRTFGFEIKTIRNKGFVIDGLTPTLV
ncbi:response regulator transcription factor [Thalassococcus sp. BH17M4-6]|uniref:response regulator transcription factor n=1 Tax=Thalassococcus sp. BH17M4-6 TaxID=3413148 RepID=UPI003BCDF7D4